MVMSGSGLKIQRDRLLQRLEAIVSTGTPGLYRVVSFLCVQHVYSLAELGRTGASMAIAQMAGFFTAIGWATLILVRLPAAADRRSRTDQFYALTLQAITTTVAGTLLFLGASAFLGRLVDFDVWPVVSLLWGWTTYQLARHYFIALKRYREAIIFDAALVLTSAIALVVCKRTGIPSSHALAIALIATAFVMFAVIGLPSRGAIAYTFELKGLQFGLTNFLSGGPPLVFIPAATAMCGATFAGMLSLLSSLSAVGQLVPRAISITKLPELARRRSAAQALDDTLQSMRRSIASANGIVSVLNAAAVFIVAFHKTPDPAMRWTAVMAGLLLTLLCAVSVMGLTSSNTIAIFEKASVSVRINVTTTVLFALLFGASTWVGGRVGFMLILCSAIGITVLRNEMLRVSAKAACFDYMSGGIQYCEVVR
ncbi:MAG: hypothetical protein P4L81_07745 [Candidatus Pacebacteria bacterium]|nr:hypothetical protein [Candidatus Paceibacterota bacterium]